MNFFRKKYKILNEKEENNKTPELVTLPEPEKKNKTKWSLGTIKDAIKNFLLKTKNHFIRI